ncbi:CbtA family protein [Nocardioides aquiterrae]|uniref:CbtA family protein n=1 Tax=Nocardioides aquiterrae TaxID=203799 RepID=A0ABN1U7N1_9ACTN
MSLWRTSLRASLLGGLAAGGVAAAFTLLVLEPTIKLALAIEDARSAAAHGHGDMVHETVLVTRGWQQVGGALAVLVSALLLSLIYSVVLTRFRRAWNVGELQGALLVALGCFAVFALAPGVKYPANPPAVGDPATVTERTTLYVGSVVLAALVAVAVLVVAGTARRHRWSATRTCWTVAAVMTAGGVLLFAGLPPSPDAIPADVGAGLVWRFRVQSLGMLALLWATIGLVSGTLLARQSRADRATAHARRALTSW